MTHALTGGIPAGGYICRPLFIPDEPLYIAAVNGVLENLTNPEYWRQFGTLTPEAAAALGQELLERYFTEGCQSMIGEVKAFSLEPVHLPVNVLICDGSIHARADYPQLYAVTPAPLVIDSNYFRVPDLQDRFILGAGTRALLTQGGVEDVTLTIDEMPTHNHTSPPHGHTSPPHSHTSPPHSHDANYPQINIDLEVPGAPDPLAAGNPPFLMPTTPAVVTIDAQAVTIDNTTVTIDDTGGSQPHDNMPPYVTLIFGIVAR